MKTNLAPNGSTLILFDADRIKDFVFATGRLKEIRGGSQLVRDATDRDQIQAALGLQGNQIIFAEGGSGLLKAEDAEAAEKICRQLAHHYRRLTHGATLTAVSEPEAGNFHAAIQRAARHLRLAKDGKRTRRQHAQSPFSQPCESCGAWPATDQYASEDMLCTSCYYKRARADDLRRDVAGKDTLYLADTPWGSRFLESLSADKRSLWRNAELPFTLDVLAALSRPDNYLGFVYADGNNLGDRVQQQDSEAEYRRFSKRVSFSLRAALWLALQTHFPEPRQHQQTQYAPFELIALGGDDVILMTVADQAIPLALTLGRFFEHISAALADLSETEMKLDKALAAGRAVQNNLDGPPQSEDVFTLSSGVVIAHPGQPILNMEEQARALLRQAKSEHSGRAAIDFHVVSSPVLRSLDAIRQQEYVRDDAHLTSRPMTVEDAEKLLRHILVFKGGDETEAVPQSKLNALYQSLFAGRDAAEFEAFFLLSRLRETQKEKLKAFFADFDIYAQRPTTPVLPWGVDDDNNIYTVFGDLIELYEFIHPGALPGRLEVVNHAVQQSEEENDAPLQS